MATAIAGSATDKLTGMVDDPKRYDIAFADILPLQLEAANEVFQDRLSKIRLLAKRAEAGGIQQIKTMSDLVPVLFAHTTYKSYPETWLTEQRWDRLAKWLDTVSGHRVEPNHSDAFADIDQWLESLKAQGHLVSCSSGTTGKCAMLNSSQADMDFSARDLQGAFAWATGIEPKQDRRIFGLAPVAKVPRNDMFKCSLAAAYSQPGVPAFDFPVPPITIGQITGMVALRKAIADGTAEPEAIARFKEISAEREATVKNATAASAEALIAARKEKLFITGMWSAIHNIAEVIRASGYAAADFHPENSLYVGGGLKGSSLPDDYREFIAETFNIQPRHLFQFYGMQEVNSTLPKCSAGRYHVPPWVMALLLDATGDNLIEPASGEQEGRAALFDLSLQGRWNGVISGDRIRMNYGVCECGNRSPSIADDIVRYSDLAGGDKISCAGTIDAYVRGVA